MACLGRRNVRCEEEEEEEEEETVKMRVKRTTKYAVKMCVPTFPGKGLALRYHQNDPSFPSSLPSSSSSSFCHTHFLFHPAYTSPLHPSFSYTFFLPLRYTLSFNFLLLLPLPSSQVNFYPSTLTLASYFFLYPKIINISSSLRPFHPLIILFPHSIPPLSSSSPPLPYIFLPIPPPTKKNLISFFNNLLS